MVVSWRETERERSVCRGVSGLRAVDSECTVVLRSQLDDLVYKYKQYKCNGQRATCGFNYTARSSASMRYNKSNIPSTKAIRRQTIRPPRYHCPYWSWGFDRPAADIYSSRSATVLVLVHVHRTDSTRRGSLIVNREHAYSPLVLCVALALALALAPLVPLVALELELELVPVDADAPDTLATPPPFATVPPVVVPDGGVSPSSSPSPSLAPLLPDEPVSSDDPPDDVSPEEEE